MNNLTISVSFLPHTDPEASLAFYRDVLGFEVRKDVGYEDMRWITVGPAGQPDTSIVLTPPAVDPGISDDERRTILELMAKGSYAGVVLTADDVDAVVVASPNDVHVEPALAGARAGKHVFCEKPVALSYGDAALTGPIVRGDVETVRAHLADIAATSPATLESYVVMARATANRAVVDGRLLPIRAAKIVGVLNDALTRV